jgi:tRNA threonylcarbamoyladenosine biosynthesis protein TsaE
MAVGHSLEGVTQELAVGLRFQTAGPEHTHDFAAALAAVLVDGDLLVLTGDLGAGKTCFTQGLGRGLGIDDRITSPTFTLANRYHGRLTLHHLDVYRLESAAETLDLGLDELFEDGVTVIEWGDKIEDALPEDRLVITLRYPEPSQPDDSVDPDNSVDAVTDDAFLAVDEREIEVRCVSAAGADRWAKRGVAEALSPWKVAS